MLNQNTKPLFKIFCDIEVPIELNIKKWQIKIKIPAFHIRKNILNEVIQEKATDILDSHM